MSDCKLNFSVIAPIPEILDTPLKYGVLGRAVKIGLVGINTFSIREYASLPNNKIDDHIYGGGAGMALMYEPIKKLSLMLLELWKVLSSMFCLLVVGNLIMRLLMKCSITGITS